MTKKCELSVEMKISNNCKSEGLELCMYAASIFTGADINILQIKRSANFLADIVLNNKVGNIYQGNILLLQELISFKSSL